MKLSQNFSFWESLKFLLLLFTFFDLAVNLSLRHSVIILRIVSQAGGLPVLIYPASLKPRVTIIRRASFWIGLQNIWPSVKALLNPK
jgi:hypothetical protein